MLYRHVLAMGRTVGWIAHWDEMIADPDQKNRTTQTTLYWVQQGAMYPHSMVNRFLRFKHKQTPAKAGV